MELKHKHDKMFGEITDKSVIIDRQPSEIEDNEKKLKDIKEQIFQSQHDIQISKVIVDIFNDPNKFSDYDLDWLAAFFVSLSCKRAGYPLHEINNGKKRLVADYHPPLIYSRRAPDDSEILEHARRKLAEYIVPFIKNKFISIEEHRNLMMEGMIEQINSFKQAKEYKDKTSNLNLEKTILKLFPPGHENQ